MEIKKIENKDLESLVELWYEVSVQAHDFIPKEYWYINKEAMRTEYLPNSECYVAWEENVIVGFVAMIEDFLPAIFIKSQMQGRGIGKKLIDYVKETRESIKLNVYKNNFKTIEFYKKNGFKILSEIIDKNTNEIELLMEWKRNKQMKFIKSNDNEKILKMRSKLYKSLKSPIDAMWEILYIGLADNYLILSDNNEIGFFCINSNNCLLQIYLNDEYLAKMDTIVKELINRKFINTAQLSSNEPIAFNACLRNSKSLITNTFCYEYSNKNLRIDSELYLELAKNEDVSAIKHFLKEQVGMDDSFGYTENLVKRKEMFLLKENGIIIANCECRISETQPEIADIGFIVKENQRGKGIATKIMKQQINRILKMGRKPICSTTLDNIASQKVIEKCGFYCSNIIFDIGF